MPVVISASGSLDYEASAPEVTVTKKEVRATLDYEAAVPERVVVPIGD